MMFLGLEWGKRERKTGRQGVMNDIDLWMNYANHHLKHFKAKFSDDEE